MVLNVNIENSQCLLLQQNGKKMNCTEFFFFNYFSASKPWYLEKISRKKEEEERPAKYRK